MLLKKRRGTCNRKIAGDIFFSMDLTNLNSVEIRIFDRGIVKSVEPYPLKL